MVNHLDLSIRPITRSKLIRNLIHQKLKSTETYISSFIDDVRCIVIYYALWISNTTQESFSMTAHYTRDHVRDHANIIIPIKTSTDGVMVGNVINQFNIGYKLVSITRDGGTNLATCKAILESTFDNMGVFDLENPMFVMDCLAPVLYNTCKEGVMDANYDNVRVDTEVTRRKYATLNHLEKEITKG